MCAVNLFCEFYSLVRPNMSFKITQKFLIFGCFGYYNHFLLLNPARYQELKEYKARTGDCNVPMRKGQPQLGEWVGQQRKAYKLKKEGKQSAMTEERMEKLNKIGFTWQLRKRKSRSEYEDARNGSGADTDGKSAEDIAEAVVEHVVAEQLAVASAAAEASSKHAEV